MKEIAERLKDIYKEVTGKVYHREEPKPAELLADGLNNKGIALFELGRKEEAIACFNKALKINPTHLSATYNLYLTEWRTGKIDDLEILRRLDTYKKQPQYS